MDNLAKDLQNKIDDFKHFAIILMAVSGFLYLGAVLPVEGKTSIGQQLLMGGTVLLLILGTLFFFFSSKYQKQLEDIEENGER
ncbi:MAG TPA: YrhC family protein [Chondromyces sp.]|nr:YrhC family protein [Chondromyces sp.]